MNRRGFTFLELLTVMLVLSILAGIAFLRYRDLTNEALAGRIGSDMNTIRLAALNHYVDTNAWPAETPEGAVPPELLRYLPENWRFGSATYTLDWDNMGAVVGVTVRSSRGGLIDKLRQRFSRGAPYVDVGDDVMYVLAAPGVGL